MITATRLLKWGTHYYLGVDEIDRQHEHIAELLNDLYQAHRSAEPRAIVGRMLNDLVAAVSEHFTTEEELMRRTGYPRAAGHKSEHGFLASQVIEFQADFAAERAELSESMMIYLKDWLRDHMLVSDRRLSEFLRSQ